jgi:hypothetical protein
MSNCIKNKNILFIIIAVLAFLPVKNALAYAWLYTPYSGNGHTGDYFYSDPNAYLKISCYDILEEGPDYNVEGFAVDGDVGTLTDIWFDANQVEYTNYACLQGDAGRDFYEEWEWSGPPGTAPGGKIDVYVNTDGTYQKSDTERSYLCSSTAETYAYGVTFMDLVSTGYDFCAGLTCNMTGEVSTNGSNSDLSYWPLDIDFDPDTVEVNDVKVYYDLGFMHVDSSDYSIIPSGQSFFYAELWVSAISYSEVYINNEEGEFSSTWSTQQTDVDFDGSVIFESN